MTLSGDAAVIECPADGGKVHAAGYRGLFLCPAFDELCGRDQRAKEFADELADASAVRFKGLTPSVGSTDGGTQVTVYGRGLAEGLVVEIGGVEAAVVAVQSDGTAAQVVTPPASADALVDVKLILNGAEDTGFGVFDYAAKHPVNLIDTAVLLSPDDPAVVGGTADLTSSYTWHQNYFAVEVDVSAAETETFYFSVFLFYGAADSQGEECHSADPTSIDSGCMEVDLSGTSFAENKLICESSAGAAPCAFDDGHEYSVAVEARGYCSALSGIAAASVECSGLDRDACDASSECSFGVSKVFVLTVGSGRHASGIEHGGAFQLLVRAGELPTRRHNDETLPDLVEVLTSGSVEYVMADCTGAIGGSVRADVCGVCGGDGTSCTANGCECLDVSDMNLGGCNSRPYYGCQWHNADGTTCADVGQQAGQSFCIVPDDCPTQLSDSSSGVKYDLCVPDPDCGYVDACGVCGGDGTSCTANGCECIPEPQDYNVCVVDGQYLSVAGCLFHNPDGTACAELGQGEGQSFCRVPDDCPTPISAGDPGVKYDL